MSRNYALGTSHSVTSSSSEIALAATERASPPPALSVVTAVSGQLRPSR